MVWISPPIPNVYHFKEIQNEGAGRLKWSGFFGQVQRMTVGRRTVVSNPIRSQRRKPTPKSEAACGRVSPLVVAMRTASRRNSSVYLVAILDLLHSKHCAKETGTKPRQDQLAKETGHSWQKLSGILAMHEIAPFSPKGVNYGRIFSRSDIETAFPKAL